MTAPFQVSVNGKFSMNAHRAGVGAVFVTRLSNEVGFGLHLSGGRSRCRLPQGRHDDVVRHSH